MKKSGAYLFGLTSLIVISLFSLQFASAGVGLKWDREAKIVQQGEHMCFTYSVYNPWDTESYAKIEVSDPLKGILKYDANNANVKLIPANTKSTNAIPVEFCFDVPYVYNEQRDCWIGTLICKQDCPPQEKDFTGEVLVTEAGSPNSGSQGSSTTTSVSVSAPLTIKVLCVPHSRDYRLIYFAVAVIALIIIIFLIVKKYRMPKLEREKLKLKQLQEEIRKAQKKKRK